MLTIGHSTHEADDFVGLLRDNAVDLLVDVRAYPASRRVPHFNAPELEATLASAGLGYRHAGELGGRRRPRPDSPNRGWQNDQFRGYADHMASDEFVAGVERVLDDAHEHRPAVMCAEAQWWRCHRRLLADALLVRGAAVLHIDSRGGIDEHRLTDFAVAEGTRVLYPPLQGELEV